MSFIITSKQDIAKLHTVIGQAGWPVTDVRDCGPFVIAVNTQGTLPCRVATTQDGSRLLVLFGEVLNSGELRSLLTIYDSGALTADDASLAMIALEALGTTSLALFEGAFSGAIIEPAARRVSLFTDCNGQMSAYSTSEPQPWFAPELKLFCLRDDFRPAFLPLDQVADFTHRGDGFCPVTNVCKTKPGEMLTVSWDGNNEPVLSRALYHAFLPTADRVISREDADNMIGRLLGDSIANCLVGSRRVGVPLSGGLDSSLVTALAFRQGANLSTFSIGTEVSTEFEFAEIVASHVGSRHQTFLLSEEEILEGMIRAIRHNEIFDGLSAEIQSPLFALYDRVQGTVDTLITGYGADLLFGGVVAPQSPSRTVNEDLWNQVYRTRWTGEFSSIGAGQRGIRVLHPFWSNRLLGFCIDLAPQLKVSSNEIKVCLREFASKNDLLPQIIAWRKKIGIHEGSSVNTIFSEVVGSNKYNAKTKFTYFAYKYMLESCRNLKAASSGEILAQFRRNQ